MKSIVARFEELKKNPLALKVDVEGEEVVANKVEAAIALAGVKLRDASGQFRNLDDVFLELAKSWDGLDRNTQRYIATIAAGSRQQSRFIAMMEGYDRTLELVELAQDSEGQSAAQFLKTLDSLDSKLNKISNSLEAVYRKFVDSDFFGGLLDSLNNFLQEIRKMDAGTIATFATVGIMLGNNLLRGLRQSLSGSEGLFTAIAGKLSGLSDTLYNKISANRSKGRNEQIIKSQIESTKNKKIKDLNNRIGSSAINLTIKDAQAIEKIKEISIKIKNLENQKSEVNISTVEGQEKIRVLDEQIGQLQNELNQVSDNISNEQIELFDENFGESFDAIVQEADEGLGHLDSRVAERTSNLRESAASAMKQVGMALVTSLAAGITTAVNSDNPFDGLLVVLSSFATIMLPQIFTIIGSVVTNGLGSIRTAADAAGGWVTMLIEVITMLIAGAATLIAHFVATNTSESQKLIENIDKLKDKQKELQETSERSTAEAAVKKTETKKLNNLVSTYDELINKTNRTTDENEKLKTTINDLTTNFPDLIGAYDEAGNAILKQRNTWNEIIEAQKESLRLSLEQAGNDKIELAQNQLDLAIKNKQLSQINTKEYFEKVTPNLKLGLHYSFNSQGVAKGLGESKRIEQEEFLRHLLTSFTSNDEQIDALLGYRNATNFKLGITNHDITGDSIQNLITELSKSTNIEEQRRNLKQFFTDLGANEDFVEEVVSQTGSNLMEFATSLQNLDNFLSEANKENADINKDDTLLDETIYSIIENYIDVFNDSSKDFSDNLKNITTQAISNSSEEIEKLKNISIKNLKSGNNLTDFNMILSSNRVSATTKEKYKNAKISDFSKITEEQEKVIQEVITEYRNSVIEEVSRLTSTTLSQIKGYLSAEDFEIINAEDWGNYSVKTIRTIINKLENVVSTDTFNELNERLNKISNNIETNFSGAFGKVADNFGINLAQLLTDKGVTEGVAQRINNIFSDISDKIKSASIIKTLVSADTDLGNLDQVKQLASLFYEVDNNEQKAIDHVIELRNALSQNFNFNLDSNSFNSTLVQLGENTNNIKKEFTDLNSAIKEYNENGRISAETILTLIENGQAQYLMYDEVTKAIRINTQEVEKAWHTKINEAKAEATIAIEDKKRLLGSVQIEIELNKQKIEELKKYTSGHHSITKAGYQDLMKLLKTHAINQENGQIQIDENSLSENQIYFKELFEDSEKAYKDLVKLALEGGEAIRQALMDGLTGQTDASKALELITAKLTLEEPPQLSSLLDSNVEKYFDEMADTYNLTLNQEAATELENYYSNRNKNLEKYGELLATGINDNEKSLKIYDNLLTNRTMSDFFEDTAKATQEANKELKKYISTLERFYNLNRNIDKNEREKQKALKEFEKNPTEENGKAYIDLVRKGVDLNKEKYKSYKGAEITDRRELKDNLTETFTENGLNTSVIKDFFGNIGEDLNQDAFEKFMAQHPEFSPELAEKLEKIWNEGLKNVQTDLDKQTEAMESIDEAQVDLDSFNKKIEELKNSIDKLDNIKTAAKALKDLNEKNKEDYDLYVESGGKEGTDFLTYTHNVGKSIQTQDDLTNLAASRQLQLQNEYSDVDKYLIRFGDYVTYDAEAFAELGDNAEETKKRIEEYKKYLQDAIDVEKDSEKEKKRLSKEYKQVLKEGRDAYNQMVMSAANALAKLDQKQIDEVKKKYAKIQEEDEKYLSNLQKSIDKQRQLRDQAKSYDDLEKDEKRLSLLQRDTSEANAAEIAALKEQIRDARQNLVDTEQDNIINNISETNTRRKEEMDEETAFLQNVMDERTYDMQYYIEQAYDIVNSALDGNEGAYQRYIDLLKQTDEGFYAATKEAQAKWLEDQEANTTKALGYAEAVSSGMVNIINAREPEVEGTLKDYAKKDNDHINDITNHIDFISTHMGLIDVSGFDELTRAAEEASKATKDLADNIGKLPPEKVIQLKWQEQPMPQSVSGNSGYSPKENIFEPPSETPIKESGWITYDQAGTVTAVTKKTSDTEKTPEAPLGSGLMVKEVDDISQWHAGMNKEELNVDPVKEGFGVYGKTTPPPPPDGDKGQIEGDTGLTLNKLENPPSINVSEVENFVKSFAKNRYYGIDTKTYSIFGPFDTEEQAKQANYSEAPTKISEFYTGSILEDKLKEFYNLLPYHLGVKDKPTMYYPQYLEGGKVDFTGLAWVDGTKTNPEAFLDAKDTQNIELLCELLSNMSLSFNSNYSNSANKNEKAGETNIEIHVNVENISSDYDVDQAVEEIKAQIVKASEAEGKNVHIIT